MRYSLKAFDLRLRSRLFGLSNKFLIRKVNLFGSTWKIPVIDYMGYGIAQGRIEEQWIYHVVKSLVQTHKISMFLDIGANIGQTLIKVKSLDAHMMYFGFEPNPNCIFYLNNLIKVNNLENVTIQCFGLGATHQLAEFHFAGLDDVCGTFKKADSNANQKLLTMALPVWPLDEVPISVNQPGEIIIKIDVEGFEPEVLEGASKFILLHRPYIIIEILPHQRIIEVKERGESVFNMLRNWNYQAYQIQRSGELKKLFGYPENADNFDEVDYLFVPDIKINSAS